MLDVLGRGEQDHSAIAGDIVQMGDGTRRWEFAEFGAIRTFELGMHTMSRGFPVPGIASSVPVGYLGR